jgi:hypothetical protein
MAAPTTQYIPLLIFVPLIIWRLYSRIRRSIGRQTLSKWRPWVTVVVFPLIIAMFALGAFAHPARVAAVLGALAGGIAAGALLGVFGTRHTKFEQTPEGLFYTPNAHIGIALSVVFVGRVIYRMFQVYSMEVQPSPADFTGSPLTLAIFGLLAGYYVTYAIGLLRWRRRVEATRA